MEARLFAKTGVFAGRSFEIGREATIGRDPGNHIVLGDPRVSGHHGRIAWDETRGCYLIEDLGSSNGTFVDGVRVREPEVLFPLSVVSFGRAGEFIFRQPTGEAPRGTLLERSGAVLPSLPEAAALGPRGTHREMEAPVLPELPGATLHERAAPPLPELGAAPPPERSVTPRFRLEVLVEPPAWRSFELAPGQHLVGRGGDCAVSFEHSTLSRRHARLTVEEGRVWITDLGSTNGTFLEDRRLEPEENAELKPGDRLLLGAVPARLEGGG